MVVKMAVLKSDLCDLDLFEKMKNAWYVHHLQYILRLHSDIRRDRFIGKCATAGNTLSQAKKSISRKRTTFNPLVALIFERYQYIFQVISVLARDICIPNYVDVASKMSVKNTIEWFLTRGHNDLDLWPWQIMLIKIDTLCEHYFTCK